MPRSYKSACPGCGAVRGIVVHCRACKKGTGLLGGDGTAWMLRQAAMMRAQDAAIAAPRPTPDETDLEAASDAYKRRRAARHPWLTIPEAAHELALSENRISQLISSGRFGIKPDTGRRRLVASTDVYSYKSQPQKRRAAA